LYEVHIHVVGVVLQLGENGLRSGFLANFDEDFYLLKLQVERIIKLAVEYFRGVLKDGWLLLKHKVYIPE